MAYALPPVPRELRAQQARLYIHSHFTNKQQLFIDFVLQHYVTTGVQELAQEKLAALLRLRYQNSIADAIADLGQPEEIGTCLLYTSDSADNLTRVYLTCSALRPHYKTLIYLSS